MVAMTSSAVKICCIELLARSKVTEQDGSVEFSATRSSRDGRGNDLRIVARYVGVLDGAATPAIRSARPAETD